ncbi:hypothetical protein K469DRAFT_725096 [Zopfia rhizophila CBS 207.26]|uniref:AB hydrolase-1 domain-containing protein n=1 Tax=Zopfia rhizophila CBS 207.26 TaxID=1314779 RepID=A0A6A6D5P8_9PEZI|nr:hypothetical protein K469DRAFT_725096 [Zopfia rhizophila CBS 207.26]
MIPVDITYDNYTFNASRWEDDYDLTDFLSIATTRAGAGYPAPLDGPKTASGTYQIAASFCTPKKRTAKAKNVIIATHGIGPARAHWNSPYRPDEYSFSLRIFTEIAVLKRLARFVKDGKYTGDIGKPVKTAVMGFSFGSYTTHGAVATMPDIADAVILTVIGFNTTGLNSNGLVRSFEPRVANQQNPALYGNLDNGYLTWVDKFGLIWNGSYFKKPNYELAAADFVELSKSPFAVAEFLSFLSGPMDASNYTGLVLAITGETDYIVCNGYCKGIFDQPGRTYYKNAKFTPYLHPGASHHINFHKNATGAYKVIIDFLGANGL